MANLTNGTQVPLQLTAGIGKLQSLSQAGNYLSWGDGSVVEASPTNAAIPTAPKTSSLLYLFGAVLIIVLFKFAVEHEKSGMQFGFLGISVYNMLAVGSLAFLFLIILKVTVNKWPIPGLTDLVNVV